MIRTLDSVKFPALAGAALALPFLILELVNRRGFSEPFPAGLFFVLWLLPSFFLLALRPLARPGGWAALQPAGRLLLLAALLVTGAAWAAIVLDQLPCFLGLPYCD